MLQRIQSIFLALASGASFSLFGVPFLGADSTASAASGLTVLNDGIFNLFDHVGLMVVAGAAGLLALVNIFLFKNRKLQIRLDTLFIVLQLVLVGLAGFLVYADAQLAAGHILPKLGVAMPFLGVVFAFLATRNIKKDEALVRSADRLR